MKKLLMLIGMTSLLAISFQVVNAQLIKTSLTLIVRDDTGNTVDKVSVKLFEKEEDYLKEVNPVAEGITDDKGVVRFKALKSIAYYVLARKGDQDNTGGGEQIGKLEDQKFNKATVVIQ